MDTTPDGWGRYEPDGTGFVPTPWDVEQEDLFLYGDWVGPPTWNFPLSAMGETDEESFYLSGMNYYYQLFGQAMGLEQDVDFYEFIGDSSPSTTFDNLVAAARYLGRLEFALPIIFKFERYHTEYVFRNQRYNHDSNFRHPAAPAA